MTNNSDSRGGSIDEAGSVTLAHGAGGLMTRNLIEYLIRGVAKKSVSNGVGLVEMDDGATVPIPGTELVVVITTDGHTVDPLFFPG
ncbi:MAG: hypothetical protein JW839_17840, partial [Candidatus Lokiarchaeota archaeon]|nr:hypothetical protein [Candidatus Lokiarchaeota archaeon]